MHLTRLTLLLLAIAPAMLHAEEVHQSGLITRMTSPTEIEVGAYRIRISNVTKFCLLDSSGMKYAVKLEEIPLHIGDAVTVKGTMAGEELQAASLCLISAAPPKYRLHGSAMLMSTMDAGHTVWLDGYPMRITSATELLHEDGSAAQQSDIQPNTWATYDAVIAPDLSNTTAQKLILKKNIIDSSEQAFLWKSAPKFVAPNYDKNIAGLVHLGTYRAAYIIPDHALQSWIEQFGEALVPVYQRDLPANDPTKIHFAFYIVDSSLRANAVVGTASGLVLVPDIVLLNLENDSQLATQMAQQIALAIEQVEYLHRVRLKWEDPTGFGMLTAPLFGGVGYIANYASSSQLLQDLNERGARIALTLMQDAGYDIRESPFTWQIGAGKPDTLSPWRTFSADLSRSVLLDLRLEWTVATFTDRAARPEVFAAMKSRILQLDPDIVGGPSAK